MIAATVVAAIKSTRFNYKKERERERERESKKEMYGEKKESQPSRGGHECKKVGSKLIHYSCF